MSRSPKSELPRPRGPSQGKAETHPLQRVVLAALAVAATALIGLLVADGYDEVLGEEDPPPLDQQLRQTQDALEAKLRLISVTKAQLRATGPESHVFLLRPRAVDDDGRSGDEIHIYDEDEDGRLQPSFRFAPRPAEGATPKSPLSSALPTRLAIDSGSFSIRDFDATPGDELIFGVYEVADRRARFPRPFIITWEPGDRKYRVDPLLSTRTVTEATVGRAIASRYLTRSIYARALVRRVYKRTTIFRDIYGSSLAPSYAVEVFRAIPRTVTSPLDVAEGHVELAVGYIVASRGVGTATKLQIVRWDIRINVDGGPIAAAPVPGEVLDVGAQSSRLDALLRRATLPG